MHHPTFNKAILTILKMVTQTLELSEFPQPITNPKFLAKHQIASKSTNIQTF